MPIDGFLTPALMALYGGAAWLGEKVAGEAVKRYAPKAFEAVEERLAGVWSLMGQGKVAEAEALVVEAGLGEAVIASAQDIRERTLVFSLPSIGNGYAARAAVLERIVGHLFEASRRWRMDLLLRGGLTGPHGLTYVQTEGHRGAQFVFGRSEIGFATTSAAGMIWVDGAQVEGAALDRDRVEGIVRGYRDHVIATRKKASGYISLQVRPGPMRPALYVDGGSVVTYTFKERDERRLALGMVIDASKDHAPLGIEAWPAGVREMWASLQQIPDWLELGPEERALLSDPTAVFGAPGAALTMV